MEKNLKILIIYNARSGHRRVNFEAYRRALIKHGADVTTRTLGSEFNLHELLEDAQNFDRVVAAGGDGTVSAVAGILRNSGKPIVAYPGGTANILAHNLRIPMRSKELAELTLSGKVLPTDLGQLEYVHYSYKEAFKHRFLHRDVAGTSVRIYFAVMAGTGFAARLMSDAEGLKARLGQVAYWLSAFLNLFPHSAEFKINLDGHEILTRGLGILIINFDKIQFDLKIVPHCHADDGKFAVVVVKGRSLFGLIPVLWSAICERIGFKRWAVPEVMEIYNASTVEVTSRPRLRLQYDGELLEKSSSFNAQVLPAAAFFVYGDSHASVVKNKNKK